MTSTAGEALADALEDTPSGRAAVRFGIPVLVGILAGFISLLRLWIGNHDALTQVVWAEDGVFPLCVRKADFLTCLTDPFAGYLLALPRLVAGLVAALPVASWALATNLLAALLAALACGFSFYWARRFGLGWLASAVIGLLPVIAPVVGLEAINALGSSYMLLLYVSTLVLALPTAFDAGASRSVSIWRWPTTILIALLLLLTTLTIPTAGIFLVLIVVQVVRRALPRRVALIWAIVIVLGLAAQWWTAAHAAKPRVIAASVESFTGWVDSLPSTVLTYWPGMQLGDYDFFGVFPISDFAWTGWLVLAALVVFGLLLVVRGGDHGVSIGLLMLTGVVVGAVPTVIGGANNRYFVVPLLLWGAAAMIALDPIVRRSRWWVVTLLVVLVAVVWSPMFGASWFRTKPAPPWQDEVARVENSCKTDPAKMERIIFSPYWPPNWGDALAEPTHPDISCVVVWKWS